MKQSITVTVQGTGDHRSDAPGAEEVINQMADLLKMLRIVESKTSIDASEKIDWRITNTSMQSPCTIEIMPEADSDRAHAVVMGTVAGLDCIRTEQNLPEDFPAEALPVAERMYARGSDGQYETTIAFSAESNLPPFVMDRPNAERSLATIRRTKATLPTSYRTLGSIEGIVTGVRCDARGHRVLQLRRRLGTTKVNCIFPSDSFGTLGFLSLDSVVSGMRVVVYGEVHYDRHGTVTHLMADRGVKVIPPDTGRPTAAEMVNPNFTGGKDSLEYLEDIRNGR